jgi:hypothetical protein
MRFFLMGMFLTLTPSVVVMTWLLWQADDLVLDRESEKEPDLQIRPGLQISPDLQSLISRDRA